LFIEDLPTLTALYALGCDTNIVRLFIAPWREGGLVKPPQQRLPTGSLYYVCKSIPDITLNDESKQLKFP